MKTSSTYRQCPQARAIISRHPATEEGVGTRTNQPVNDYKDLLGVVDGLLEEMGLDRHDTGGKDLRRTRPAAPDGAGGRRGRGVHSVMMLPGYGVGFMLPTRDPHHPTP